LNERPQEENVKGECGEGKNSLELDSVNSERQVNEGHGGSLSENSPPSTSIHSEKSHDLSPNENKTDTVDSSVKPPAPLTSRDLEPISPTPLPETSTNDNDGFIEGRLPNQNIFYPKHICDFDY